MTLAYWGPSLKAYLIINVSDLIACVMLARQTCQISREFLILSSKNLKIYFPTQICLLDCLCYVVKSLRSFVLFSCTSKHSVWQSKMQPQQWLFLYRYRIQPIISVICGWVLTILNINILEVPRYIQEKKESTC